MKPETLIAWRERLHFTQKEASMALGCPYRTYQAWENGENAMPSHLGLACAALSLGVKAYPEPLAPHELPAQKTGFDRNAYQREYMRKYRKKHKHVPK